MPASGPSTHHCTLPLLSYQDVVSVDVHRSRFALASMFSVVLCPGRCVGRFFVGPLVPLRTPGQEVLPNLLWLTGPECLGAPVIVRKGESSLDHAFLEHNLLGPTVLVRLVEVNALRDVDTGEHETFHVPKRKRPHRARSSITHSDALDESPLLLTYVLQELGQAVRVAFSVKIEYFEGHCGVVDADGFRVCLLA